MKDTNELKLNYVQHLGNDLTVVNAARVSYGKSSSKLNKKDEKLINYLAKHSHFTPFEHCHLTVLIECPLYIRSQIMRHRSFSFNEASRRYTSQDIVMFSPKEFRLQHESSKQCSSDEILEQNEAHLLLMEGLVLMQACENYYNKLINDYGVARKLARGYLPQNLMTKFYMTGNLRSWMQFVKLRIDEHSQKEAQELTKMLLSIILEKFPVSGKALLDNL